MIQSLVLVITLTTMPSVTPVEVPKHLACMGELQFGMTIAEAKARVPELAPQTGPPRGRVLKSPDIDRYVLTPCTGLDLPHPTEVELRFWKGQLWSAVFFTGDNDIGAVEAALRQVLGMPNSDQKFHVDWSETEPRVTLIRNSSFYVASDSLLSRAVQASFLAMLKGEWVPGQEMSYPAEAAFTPAAATAAGTKRPE